ncbi:hypothetical protein [Staphylococcus capitis]|uniref:hypothetical protein n=1 Tax=Staphylococcus capitis TaxID=29388 RepID=UPI00145B4DBD|nr:hypothetical protein [Staphylococcus capitis]NMK90611.1 hypothetical protein [Staphylococcus capitis]NMK92050.1 hypothetical protein [Staphylococcus capitis]
MRQIELIKGTANEMVQLEELVNDFLARTNGRVIDVTTAENVTPTGIKHPVIIYTIEYDNDVNEWATLFNYVTQQQFSYEDVLKAFFLLDDPNMTKDVIDELVNTYKEKGIVNDLCERANIAYKTED